jgi:predicted MPP superfamily phosphohydrolase
MYLLLLLLALLGHAFFWIGLVNRFHAFGIRRWIINLGTAASFLLAAVIPIGLAGWLYAKGPERLTFAPWRGTIHGIDPNGLVAIYAIACWMVAAATVLRLVWLRCLARTPPMVRFHGKRQAKIDPRSAEFGDAETSHHLLTRLPLNEILRLDVTDWTLDVPRLAPALDGFSIVHLSDFHLTGRVDKAYFREVVRTSNELQPDLVALTGDLIESADRFDWIPDTLGRLTARHGVYFVLGNHDLLTRDVPRLRHMLEQSGLVDLGGRQRQIHVNGQPVLLMGNELPWIKHDPAGVPLLRRRSAPSAPPSGTACDQAVAQLRIVLAHTPDQLGWARARDADLMLAGHTHGGQICIPPLGAIFSPSLWGVKHISGIYYSPPTILHVTPGVSGDTPLRWNCPPEIARLRLLSAHAKTN